MRKNVREMSSGMGEKGCLTAGGAFPLIGEEEDDGMRGGALGCPLRVALLPVRSRGGWNGMEHLVIDLRSSPS